MKSVIGRGTRILVIEDLLETGMKEALRELLPGAHITFASTAADARDKLLSGRYHVVSFDLALPHSRQRPELRPQFGTEVLEGAVASLCRKIVFSGHSNSSEGRWASDVAARHGILYLVKFAGEDADWYPPRASAYGWAACIATLVEMPVPDGKDRDFVEQLLADDRIRPRLTPYFGSYWSEAMDVLPPPLAREARVIAGGLGRKRLGAEQLLAANRFRQWCLVLASVQSSVLARHLGLAPRLLCVSTSDDEALNQLEGEFRTGWPRALEPWDSMPTWYSFLGVASGGATAFGHALEGARRFRNRNVHSLVPGEELDSQEFKSILIPLMDAAAYWAEHPWLSSLRFEDGQWLAEPAVGMNRTSRMKTLPSEMRLRAPSSDRVYQVSWRLTKDKVTGSDAVWIPELVDAWPWLRRLRAASGWQVAALWYPLAPPRAGKQRWRAYSFDGEPFEVVVGTEEFEPLVRR